MRHYLNIFISLFTLLLGIFACSETGQNPSDVDITLPDSNLTYIDDMRPFFIAKCASRSGCHSFIDQEGGLHFNDYPSIRNHIVKTEFCNEPLVIPGDGDNSILYKILLIDGECGLLRMPEDGPYLNQNNTNGVKIWIDEGLKQ